MSTAGTRDCKSDPGVFAPRVDRTRCEGKEDCARACPYDVFDIRALTKEERAPLSLFVRFKVRVHGGKQAFAERAHACRACDLCVSACPEHAIVLDRVDGLPG